MTYSELEGLANITYRSDRLEGTRYFVDSNSVIFKKFVIEMASNEICRNYLYVLRGHTNLYDAMYRGGWFGFDTTSLNKLGSIFQRYFIDVGDYVSNPQKYMHHDLSWHIAKLEDSLLPYQMAVKYFLEGLDFNEQKKLLLEAFKLSITSTTYPFTTPRQADVGFAMKTFDNEIQNMDNLDILLKRISAFIFDYATFFVPPQKERIMCGITIATQIFSSIRYYLIRMALVERGILRDISQGSQCLSCLVHTNFRQDVSGILYHGIVPASFGSSGEKSLSRKLDYTYGYVNLNVTIPDFVQANNERYYRANRGKGCFVFVDPFSVLGGYGQVDILFLNDSLEAWECYCSYINRRYGASLHDFRCMFADEVAVNQILNIKHINRNHVSSFGYLENLNMHYKLPPCKINEPTNPSATILVEGRIAPSAIICITDLKGNMLYRNNNRAITHECADSITRYFKM